MRARATVIVLRGRMVMMVGIVVRVSVGIAAGVLVMPERHALSGDDDRHALPRDRQAED